MSPNKENLFPNFQRVSANAAAISVSGYNTYMGNNLGTKSYFPVANCGVSPTPRMVSNQAVDAKIKATINAWSLNFFSTKTAYTRKAKPPIKKHARPLPSARLKVDTTPPTPNDRATNIATRVIPCRHTTKNIPYNNTSIDTDHTGPFNEGT